MGLSLGMKFDEHGRIIWPPLPSQTAPPLRKIRWAGDCKRVKVQIRRAKKLS